MTTFYVDNLSGFDANNGLAPQTPVKTWNAANIGGGTFNPGDKLLFKSGVVYNGSVGRVAPAFSATPTAALPFIVSTYGGSDLAILDGGGTRDIGFRPAVSIDQANGPAYVTLENFEIRRYSSIGATIGEVSDNGTHFNGCTFQNLWVHDIGGAGQAGIKSQGTHFTVRDCLVEDVAGDGIFVQGAYQYVGHNTIRRVSNTSGGLGDGIQFNANSHYSIIEWNDITRENSDKQALLVCGEYCQIRFNTLRGISVGAGLMTLFPSSGTSLGNSVHGNLLYGTDGIFMLDANGPHFVFGNVCIGTNPNESDANSTGIDHNSVSTVHQIFNNTVIGLHRGIYARACNVRNNIVINCGGVGIDSSVGSNIEAYNCSYNNGTNFTAAAGTGSISINPELRSDYMAMATVLRAGGTFLKGTDFYGKRFNSIPSIGAVQYQPKLTSINRVAKTV